MPLTKSAKKALRNSVKKTEINAYFKVSMKNATKAATKAIKAEAENVGELLVQAQKRIDKAAKKNIISKKSASRKVSALMSAVPTGTIKAKVKSKSPAALKSGAKAESKKPAALKSGAKK
jgi:small subunit ribosomal protein S20